jgi:hypothetical protein
MTFFTNPLAKRAVRHVRITLRSRSDARRRTVTPVPPFTRAKQRA